MNKKSASSAPSVAVMKSASLKLFGTFEKPKMARKRHTITPRGQWDYIDEAEMDLNEFLALENERLDLSDKEWNSYFT